MRQWLAALPLILLWSCHSKPNMIIPKDIHSFSNPQQISVTHLDLDLTVLFDQLTLQGTAILTLNRHDKNAAALILDSRDLQIDKAEFSTGNSTFHEAQFSLGAPDPHLGRALTIQIPPNATLVRIRYSSSPSASGLQWLAPEQTAGKRHPYLYSQSEAIHARSWIPLQDSPGVRLTYQARIHTPADLVAVMGAEREVNSKGNFSFHMNEAIPSYLIALAVGDLAFQPTGNRTGVFAEPSVLPRAATEFADTEKMIVAAEKLFGPYRWGRYDILVLPPSFPFGGMENPRLTFATPTILAGDKSLVSLVAHELAHSWSGNLVTNATWSDFWLNEGFTVYFERRIIEEVYGRERAEMEASLGHHEVEAEIKSLPAQDTILHVDLTGRDPDDGMTQVPYEKGALFLLSLERQFGRDRFDKFLRGYFEHFAFQSIATTQAIDYIKTNLDPAIDFQTWIYQPGLPANTPVTDSAAFRQIEAAASAWTANGKLPVSTSWSTQEWMHFLRSLPPQISSTQMLALDSAFHFTRSQNNEVLQQWLLMAVHNNYAPAQSRLAEFLTTVGRRKYLKPLYEELVKTDEGKKRALEIYEQARPGYHHIAQGTVDAILGR